MSQEILRSVTQVHMRQDLPDFGAGDTVRVHALVIDETRDGKIRERIQVFEGVVLGRGGAGISEHFLVRRIAAHNVGVERSFLIHSPRIDHIEVVRRGKVRRAKIYYLRNLRGKAARIKERR